MNFVLGVLAVVAIQLVIQWALKLKMKHDDWELSKVEVRRMENKRKSKASHLRRVK